MDLMYEWNLLLISLTLNEFSDPQVSCYAAPHTRQTNDVCVILIKLAIEELKPHF